MSSSSFWSPYSASFFSFKPSLSSFIHSSYNLRVILGTPEDVLIASKLSYSHEFITSFTDGYSTDVGESAVMVSGGQKQVIGSKGPFCPPLIPLIILPLENSYLEDCLSYTLFELNLIVILLFHALCFFNFHLLFSCSHLISSFLFSSPHHLTSPLLVITLH